MFLHSPQSTDLLLICAMFDFAIFIAHSLLLLPLFSMHFLVSHIKRFNYLNVLLKMNRVIYLASSNPVTGTGGASKVISAYYDFFSRLNHVNTNFYQYDIKPVIFHDCSFNIRIFRYLPALKTLFLPLALFNSFRQGQKKSLRPILWWHSFGILDIFILTIIRTLTLKNFVFVIVTLHNPVFFDNLKAMRSKIYFAFVRMSGGRLHFLNNSYKEKLSSGILPCNIIESSYISVNPLPNSILQTTYEQLSSSSIPAKRPRSHIFAMCQLIPGKQIDHLLHAFSLLPSNWTLSIAGKGSELENLIDLSCRLDISCRVNFMGFLDDEQKTIAFSKSSIFCVPSISDTQSIVNIEAIAHGVPLALYPYAPFLDLYEKYPSIYFSKDFTIQSLAQSIISAEACSLINLKESQQQLISDFGDSSIVKNFSDSVF